MEILFVLIPLSVLLIAFALWSFIWSVKNDQFEDLDRQGWSILFNNKDDEPDSEQTSPATEEHIGNPGEDAEPSAPGDHSEAKQQ